MNPFKVPLAVFYVSYLSSATGAELLKRHRRDWIIASFTVDEGYQGPFPYQLGKVRTGKAWRTVCVKEGRVEHQLCCR